MSSTLVTDAVSLIKIYGAQAPGWALDHAEAARESHVRKYWKNVADKARQLLWYSKKTNPPTRLFELGEDPEYGTTGLRPFWVKGLNYGSGMQAAHDVLEHFPKDKGYITDEFQALGASLYVRMGNTYYEEKGRRSSVEENISSDMIMLFNYVLSGQYAEGPIDSVKTGRRIDDFDEKEFLSECRNLKGEYDEKQTQKEFFTFCKKAIPWIRKGYYRAKRRYAGVDRYMLLNIFTTIEKDVDRIIEQYGGDYNGIQVKVSFNTKTGNVRVWAPEVD